MTAQSTTSKDFLTSIVGEINGGVPAFQRDVAEVLLDTLLVTLRGDKLSLSHVLLGLAPALDSTYSSRWDIALNASFSSTSDWRRSGGNNHPNLAVPTTVLGQILLMLEDSVDIITQQPSLAALCYEIIYSLCKLKYTSSVVLSYLRISRVNVGGSTMKFLPYIVRQCLSALRYQAAEAAAFEDNRAILSLDTSSSLLCTAWVLKTLALELRSVEAMGRKGIVMLSTELQELLFLYTDVMKAPSSSTSSESEQDQERSSESYIGFREVLAAAINAGTQSSYDMSSLSDVVEVQLSSEGNTSNDYDEEKIISVRLLRMLWDRGE